MRKLKQDGFTLIEVLVISPILIIVVVSTLSFLFNQYGQLVRQGGELNLRIEAQSILFGLQDEIFYANRFDTTINGGLEDSYSASWSDGNSSNRLITSYPALTTSRRDENRQLAYINEIGCDPETLEENSVLYNNTIFYSNANKLYKRTVTAPSTMSTCGSSYFTQTCPPENATESCKSDVLLTDHLSSFSVTYYDTGGALSATPLTAELVKVDIVLADIAFGEDISTSSSITLRRVNQ